MDDREILESVANRTKDFKPLPPEFYDVIDDEFWNLF